MNELENQQTINNCSSIGGQELVEAQQQNSDREITGDLRHQVAVEEIKDYRMNSNNIDDDDGGGGATQHEMRLEQLQEENENGQQEEETLVSPPKIALAGGQFMTINRDEENGNLSPGGGEYIPMPQLILPFGGIRQPNSALGAIINDEQENPESVLVFDDNQSDDDVNERVPSDSEDDFLQQKSQSGIDNINNGAEGSGRETALDQTGPISNSNTEELTTFRGGYIPPPLPILPKALPDYEPPKCPLEHISFILLKKFQSFGEPLKPDQLGVEFNKYQSKRKKKDPDDLEYGDSPIPPTNLISPVVTTSSPSKLGSLPVVPVTSEIEEIPTFVNNIVFCRDKKQLAKIDEQNKFSSSNPGYYNLRHLIQHENYLNIKTLIKNNTLQTEMERYENINRMKQNQKRKPGVNGAPRIGTDTEAFISQLADGAGEKTILFESRFESGNLFLAQKVSANEYNLLMQNDINTQGHTQWFYFRVQNTKQGHQCKFNIINYSKPDSLFNYGMKVAIYSEKKAEIQKVSWFRGGTNISYFANNIRKEPLYMGKTYYTLTFTYDFEYDNDSVFFAYSVPYTYTDLLDDIVAIEMDPARGAFISRKTLCKTIGGINCDYLTITSREKKENATQRKCVIISARVHPGETVGSWMMRGVIKFITDPNNIEARLLRENFIFKIIPMLNPDGVVNGNYRCSLAGCDLNRRWKTPSKVIHPTIYSTKQLVKESHEERGIFFFCDLHGHSRKHNVFMYGCHNQKLPEETRIFPYLLSKISQYFSFDYSRFGVQKSKDATARVALFKELKDVPNIFTMESTFSGMDFGSMKGNHLSTDDLEKMGRDLMRGLCVYCELHLPNDLLNVHNVLLQNKGTSSNDLDKKTFKEDLKIGNGILKSLLAEELKLNGQLLKNQGDSSSGSESAPSDDNLQPEEIIKIIPVIDKKTKKDLEQKKLKMQQQQQIANQQLKEKLLKEQQAALQSAKKGVKKSPSKSNLLDKKKNEKVKLPNIDLDSKKDEKKPKPEMIDAWTQTDRSDYAIIKSRLKSLGRDAMMPLPGSLNSMLQKQSALDNHPALRLKSHRPHQLNTLTRTPGGYSSTPGNHMPLLSDNKHQEFAAFLHKQQSATNQQPPSNFDSLGGITSTASKYSNQLSMYANSDVNLKNLRSPTHLSVNNPTNSLISSYSNNRELTNRTNVPSSSRFQQPMSDQQYFQNKQAINSQLLPQQLFKQRSGINGGINENSSNGPTAIQNIIDQNKYNSLSSSLSSGMGGGQQFYSPNVKRQIGGAGPHPISSQQSSLFKSNRNDTSLAGSQSMVAGAQQPVVVGSIQQEQANIKKLISGVQMSFKNGQSELTKALISEMQMQSPGRTPASGFQSHSLPNNHKTNTFRSPSGAVVNAMSGSQNQGNNNPQKQPTTQNEMMFPQLKNKYNTINGVGQGTQGPQTLGAALQQIVGKESSVSPQKQINGGIGTSPMKKTPILKNSNVNFVSAPGNNNIPLLNLNNNSAIPSSDLFTNLKSNGSLATKRNSSQQRHFQIAGGNIGKQTPLKEGSIQQPLGQQQVNNGMSKRDSQKNIIYQQ